MDKANYFKTKIIRNAFIIISSIILPLFIYLGFINPLLFHTTVEFAIITIGVIGSVVGILTAFRIRENIVSKISQAIFVYVILLFIHMLSFTGMSIFIKVEESFSSQIWLSGKLILALGFLSASISPRSKAKVYIRITVACLLGIILFFLAYLNIFPITVQNGDPTIFAYVFQGLIIAIYIATIIIGVSKESVRKSLDCRNIFSAILLLLITEILMINHSASQETYLIIALTLTYVASLMIMYSIFVVNLIRPYNALYTAIIEDNLLQRRLKEENQDFFRRLSRSQEIAHVGSWEMNTETGVIWASDEAFKIYGLEIGNNNVVKYNEIKRIALKSERKRLDLAMNNLINNNDDYNIIYTIKTDNGEYHHIHSVATLEFRDNLPSMVYGVIDDITDLKNEQDKLLYASYHDHLTNVYNRRYFLEKREVLNFKKYLPLSTFILDINGLKIINDSFGHHVGNQVLRKIAHICNTFVNKDNSFIARIGGDEFAIILPNTDDSEAEKLMTDILKKIKEEKVDNINLSIAYGLAVKHDESEVLDDVLKAAEDDMYLHKISDSQSVRNGIIDALLKTLYQKDTISEEHSRRVSDLAYKLAKAAGLSEKNSADIKTAGSLHDIGKITISNDILNKKGKLDDNEFAIIKTHPEKGYKIIHSIGGMDIIANYVLEHHERWDGFGYPKRIASTDISLEGRIICIADAFDAMTSYREYKDKLTNKEAIAELNACKGKQFDPDLVDIFIAKVLKHNNKKGAK